MGSFSVKVVESVRMMGSTAGFALAYRAMDTPLSSNAIRILALTYAIALCGTCAFEGLFMAQSTALEKGYAKSAQDDRNPYQRQNTMWFLAATIVGVSWASRSTEASGALLLYVVLVGVFFVLSAANHTWEAIVHGNRTWQNLNRPFLSLALVTASLPIVMAYR